MAEEDFLRKRAESFFSIGKERARLEDLPLAAFNFEQATQLYLKYFLFKKLADFPKLHSLDLLLKQLGKAYEKEKQTEKFRQENASTIGDLNQAYLTSRYLPVEFNQFQVKKMQEFVEKLIVWLKKICQ